MKATTLGLHLERQRLVHRHAVLQAAVARLRARAAAQARARGAAPAPLIRTLAAFAVELAEVRSRLRELDAIHEPRGIDAPAAERASATAPL